MIINFIWLCSYLILESIITTDFCDKFELGS